MIVRALSVEIFEGKLIGNCSNDGISSRFQKVLIQCEDGNVDVDLDNPPENFCIIAERCGYKFVRPYANPTGIGWMAGGTLVYSCDSRFAEISEYPLSLHDRQETKELYDLLSQ